MAKSNKWIQGAIKRPGDLTRKAKAKGQTVAEYCADTKNKSTRTKRQCALAKTLRRMRSK